MPATTTIRLSNADLKAINREAKALGLKQHAFVSALVRCWAAAPLESRVRALHPGLLESMSSDDKSQSSPDAQAA